MTDRHLRVALPVCLKGRDEALQQGAFVQGERFRRCGGGLRVVGAVVGRLVFFLRWLDGGPVAQHARRGDHAGLDRAADPAQEQGAQEAGAAQALAQLGAELLRRVVGALQVERQADGLVVPFAQELHGDGLEQRLARFGVDLRLQLRPGAADDAPDEGVVVGDQAREEAAEPGTVGRAEARERFPAGNGFRIVQAKAPPEQLEVLVLLAGRQRVAAPLPAFDLVRRQSGSAP